METVIDANAASSPADTGEVEVSPNATVDSLPTPDVNAESSTASEQLEESQPTKQDAEFEKFSKTFEKIAGKPEDSQESETETEEAAPEKTDERKADEGEGKETKALSQESEKSFSDKPEWKKLNELKVGESAKRIIQDGLRAVYKRENELTEQIEQAKPDREFVREIFDSCGGNQKGVDNIRNLIKVNDSNPAEAVPMFKMLLDDAMKRAGMVLQSPELTGEASELQKQLDDGLIDQTAFDKRTKELLELEQVRTGQKRAQAQTEAQRQEQQRAQAEAKQLAQKQSIDKTEGSWVDAKLKSDPDFKAVETVYSAFAQKNALDFVKENNRWPTTAKEIEGILEKSLKQAKDEAAKFRPKPKARQATTSEGNGSSGNNRQQPRTPEEKFNAIFDKAVERQMR
jgi:hypothetical protein